MRTLPLNGMLTSLSTNYNRRNKDVRLYERANIYIPKPLGFAVSKSPYLHPGRQAVIDMRYVTEYADFNAKYKGLPKFPAVTRDISLVMKKGILAGQIENIIRKKGGKHRKREQIPRILNQVQEPGAVLRS